MFVSQAMPKTLGVERSKSSGFAADEGVARVAARSDDDEGVARVAGGSDDDGAARDGAAPPSWGQRLKEVVVKYGPVA